MGVEKGVLGRENRHRHRDIKQAQMGGVEGGGWCLSAASGMKMVAATCRHVQPAHALFPQADGIILEAHSTFFLVTEQVAF